MRLLRAEAFVQGLRIRLAPGHRPGTFPRGRDSRTLVDQFVAMADVLHDHRCFIAAKVVQRLTRTMPLRCHLGN